MNEVDYSKRKHRIQICNDSSWMIGTKFVTPSDIANVNMESTVAGELVFRDRPYLSPSVIDVNNVALVVDKYYVDANDMFADIILPDTKLGNILIAMLDTYASNTELLFKFRFIVDANHVLKVVALDAHIDESYKLWMQ